MTDESEFGIYQTDKRKQSSQTPCRAKVEAHFRLKF